MILLLNLLQKFCYFNHHRTSAILKYINIQLNTRILVHTWSGLDSMYYITAWSRGRHVCVHAHWLANIGWCNISTFHVCIAKSPQMCLYDSFISFHDYSHFWQATTTPTLEKHHILGWSIINPIMPSSCWQNKPPILPKAMPAHSSFKKSENIAITRRPLVWACSCCWCWPVVRGAGLKFTSFVSVHVHIEANLCWTRTQWILLGFINSTRAINFSFQFPK